MKKESIELPQTPHLSIEKLLRTLETLSKETTRISRAKLDEIFRALRFELPYSSTVINATLAFAIFADSPRSAANTMLNETVIHLSKALINPTQTTGLAQAIQTYYESRKKTETEYAAEIAEVVVADNPLDAFPESGWDGLRDLALTVMEKTISEKLARRIPGYKSQSVLELINPFLRFRLPNASLEKIKIAQPQVFKKWLTNIAHEGYEKINNEQRFTLILKEKETAFATFSNYIFSKSQNKSSLSRYIEKIIFSQKDKNKKFDSLNKKLDELLPADSILAESNAALHTRFYDQLRKLFGMAEKDPAVYHSEDSILDAQDKAYSQVKNDLAAIEKIIDTFTDLDKNYSKNLMAALLGRNNLNQIKSIVLSGLIGHVVKKRNLNTGELVLMHDGGYPQKNLEDIFNYLMVELQKFADTATGMFSSGLKSNISNAIQKLAAARGGLQPEEKFDAPVAVVETVEPEIEPEVAPPPRFEIPIETHTPPKSFGPIPKSRLEIPERASDPEPVIEVLETHAIPVTIETIAEITAAPEPIREEPITAPEPIKEFSEPSVALEPINVPPAPEPISEPAEIQSTSEPINEAPATPEPVTNNPEVVSEPELPENNFDDEEIPIIEFEPVKFSAPEPEEAPTVSDPGLAIMSNYELSDFKEPVHEAWKTMLVQAVSAQPDVTDINIIAQEQAINFYVVCDLVQQVASINEDMLSPENKEMLISIQTLLLAALKDPLEENNWTFFEGTRRNDVDRAIAMLKG